MKWISLVLATALLVQVGYVPCAAQEAVMLKGDEIDSSILRIGAYVEVTHYIKKDKKRTDKGSIKSVEDDGFTIGRGFWKERIEYRNVITLKIEGFDLFAFPPGSRVRITARSVADQRIVGTLAKLDADSLMLKPEDGRQLVVPLASISRFEVSPGQKSRAKTGAVIGCLVGATAGILFIDFIDREIIPPAGMFLGGGTKRPRKEGFVLFVFLCAGSTIMGGIIGDHIHTERWKQVPLPVRMSLSPQRHGGLMLSASFAF